MGGVKFGTGTLYVDGAPYAQVYDIRVSIDGPQPDPVRAGPRDRGKAEVSFDQSDFAAFADRWSLQDQIRKRMVEAVQAAFEAELFHMLGQWVSELEPHLLYDYQGRLVGLTIAGLLDGVEAPIVVRARPIVFGESDCPRCRSRTFSAGVNIDPTRCPRCG